MRYPESECYPELATDMPDSYYADERESFYVFERGGIIAYLDEDDRWIRRDPDGDWYVDWRMEDWCEDPAYSYKELDYATVKRLGFKAPIKGKDY